MRARCGPRLLSVIEELSVKFELILLMVLTSGLLALLTPGLPGTR
jgi:hypothetical protein